VVLTARLTLVRCSLTSSQSLTLNKSQKEKVKSFMQFTSAP
jgi:hypothetical protein